MGKEKKEKRKKEGRKEKFDRGLIRFAHWKKEEGRRKGRKEKFVFPGSLTVQVSQLRDRCMRSNSKPTYPMAREVCSGSMIPCQENIA